MNTLFQWSHPLTQIFALLVGLVAFLYGFMDFLRRHCGKKILFPWKKHVRWGTLALILWMFGTISGFTLTWVGYDTIFITDEHAYVGVTIFFLAIASLFTGFIMDKYKKNRKKLPIIHGIINLILIILVLWQAVTGHVLMESFF